MAEAEYVGQPEVDFRAPPPREAAIAALAERQHGVVTVSDLAALGLGKAAVARRAAEGRLHRVHRGVYAVGRPTLTADGRMMAAALAFGPAAVVSHRSAAALHGLRPDNRRIVDVCLARSSVRARPGIRVHRSGTLTRADITNVAGIPSTTVARTLVDLGEDVSRREVERAVDRAEILRVFDLTKTVAALDRAGPRKSATTLRTILTSHATPTLTESELEERFLALITEAGIPSPVVNAWITPPDGGPPARVDFLWPDRNLIVETDGRAYHATRQAFEADRLRDQRLTLAGFTVVRFTWRQVLHEGRQVVATVARLLSGVARLALP